MLAHRPEEFRVNGIEVTNRLIRQFKSEWPLLPADRQLCYRERGKMKKTVNIGIIGTGVGIRMHLPGFLRTGKANIVGIVDIVQERAEEVAAKFDIPRAFRDYRELCELPEVDLVCVATPNLYHYEQVLCALERDKHVLSEKPLATNMKEILELNAAAKKSTKLTMINHELRFNPYLRKVRDLIRSGEIGRPYFIRIHHQTTTFSDLDAPWSWSFDAKMGGGVRLAMASHLVDLLWFWLGRRKIYHLKGAMDVVVPKRRDQTGKVRDASAAGFFSSNMAMEGNLDVQLSTTWAAIGEERFDFSVYGTEGELHFDVSNKLTGAFLSHRGVVESISVAGVLPEEMENRITIFRGSFAYFARRVVESVLTKSREPVAEAATFEEAIPIQQVLDAIKESAIKGELVKLNDGYEPGARF